MCHSLLADMKGGDNLVPEQSSVETSVLCTVAFRTAANNTGSSITSTKITSQGLTRSVCKLIQFHPHKQQQKLDKKCLTYQGWMHPHLSHCRSRKKPPFWVGNLQQPGWPHFWRRVASDRGALGSRHYAHSPHRSTGSLSQLPAG